MTSSACAHGWRSRCARGGGDRQVGAGDREIAAGKGDVGSGAQRAAADHHAAKGISAAADRNLVCVGLRQTDLILRHAEILRRYIADPDSARADLAVNGYRYSRSAFKLVLLVPEGVVEIDDTLTEGAAAGGDTHIGAGQTCPCPSGLIGALDGSGALGATCREHCGKAAN